MLEIIAVCLGIITLASVGLSCYALHRSIEAQIEVRAMKASTHQVQFVPIDPTAPDDDKAVEKEMEKEEAAAWERASEMAIQSLA